MVYTPPIPKAKLPVLLVLSLEVDEPEDLSVVIKHVDPPNIPDFSGEVRVVVGDDVKATLDFLDKG